MQSTNEKLYGLSVWNLMCHLPSPTHRHVHTSTHTETHKQNHKEGFRDNRCVSRVAAQVNGVLALVFSWAIIPCSPSLPWTWYRAEDDFEHRLYWDWEHVPRLSFMLFQWSSPRLYAGTLPTDDSPSPNTCLYKHGRAQRMTESGTLLSRLKL